MVRTTAAWWLRILFEFLFLFIFYYVVFLLCFVLVINFDSMKRSLFGTKLCEDNLNKTLKSLRNLNEHNAVEWLW